MSKTRPPRAPLNFLGLACAIGVSTIYFNQPLLVDMGRTYGAPAGKVMFVSGATQVGYALGLLLFVPLGDVLERRSLMMRMYAAVIVALLLVSLAPTLSWLIAGSVVLGMVASVTHIVLPIAPDLVSSRERGRAIGKVMMGLLLGILLARTFSGWVSKLPSLFVHAPRIFPQGALWVTDGWRYVFVIAAVMNAGFLIILGRRMPRLPPKQELSYGEAMRSLWTLWRTQPLLRRVKHDWRAGVCLRLAASGRQPGLSAEQPLRGSARALLKQLWSGWRCGHAGCAICGQDGRQTWNTLGFDCGHPRRWQHLTVCFGLESDPAKASFALIAHQQCCWLESFSWMLARN